MDDISVATCSPNLAFTPNNNPTVCSGNTVDLGAWVRSYFDNYVYFKWQKSTDNGTTWSDAGSVGTGSPTWNGTAWEYYTAYPTFIATSADSGLKFRVVVASTVTNISNSNCSFADVTSILTLNVISCGSPLETDIISFTGKLETDLAKLNWTTSKEELPVRYVVERSMNGINFIPIDTVEGYYNNAAANYYSWSEDIGLHQNLFYRIRLVSGMRQRISRIVRLSINQKDFEIKVPNPFTSELNAEITATQPQLVYLQLIDNSGKIVSRQQFAVLNGVNQLQMGNTTSLAKGLYTLQVQYGNAAINKKVLKQ